MAPQRQCYHDLGDFGMGVNGRRARSNIGTPAISRYCLGTLPPSRSPRPAATTTTPTSRGKRSHQLFDVIQSDDRHSRDGAGGSSRGEHAAEAESGGFG